MTQKKKTKISTSPKKKLTVPDLKQLAKSRGFTGYSKLRKQELLNLLGM